MKKILSLTLVAVLSVSLVAGLSASALTTVYHIDGIALTQSMGRSTLPFTESNLASIAAERFTANSSMIGQSIVQMDIPLMKAFVSAEGKTKLNGNIIAGVFNDDGSVVRQFGTFKPKDLNNVGRIQIVNFTISPAYTVQAGDNIGIKYSQPQTNEEGFLIIMTDPNIDFEGGISYFVLETDFGGIHQNSTEFTTDLAMTLYTQ